MAHLKPAFAFEIGTVMLPDGVYNMLDDAERRWFVHSEEPYEGLGPSFRILYRLHDGPYVLVTYSLCQKRYQSHQGEQLVLWTSDHFPIGGIVKAEEAVRFLLRGQQQIPADLLETLERIRNPAPRPNRPIDDWRGKGYLDQESEIPAHEVDVLSTADAMVGDVIRLLQEVRDWSTNPFVDRHNSQLCVPYSLFVRYPVDFAHWWGPATEIPPRRLPLELLRWPESSAAARQLLASLRDDLEAPLCALADRSLLSSQGVPTQEEREAAEQQLQTILPELERKTLDLRRELAVLKDHPEIEQSELAAKVPPKRPSDEAFRIFMISISTGHTQNDIAAVYTETSKQPMTQGQVSKHLKAVKEWLDAGNHLPVLAPPPIRNVASMDPSDLDVGAPRDGHTPRQRNKADRE